MRCFSYSFSTKSVFEFIAFKWNIAFHFVFNTWIIVAKMMYNIRFSIRNYLISKISSASVQCFRSGIITLIGLYFIQPKECIILEVSWTISASFLAFVIVIVRTVKFCLTLKFNWNNSLFVLVVPLLATVLVLLHDYTTNNRSVRGRRVAC
jgi:hypothetical protein